MCICIYFTISVGVRCSVKGHMPKHLNGLTKSLKAVGRLRFTPPYLTAAVSVETPAGCVAWVS